MFVGVTDVGAGAKTTMGLIAAEALDVPLSKVEVVWGDTDRCPYSVGESGSRTTIMTGTAVVEAARDIKEQVADKGMPTGEQVYVASASPNPRLEGKVRASFGAHFCEVEVDTELGDVRVTKYTTVHDSGRLMNPLSAKGQIQGAVIQGIGMALHEDMVYDRRTGQPLTGGYYSARDRRPTSTRPTSRSRSSRTTTATVRSAPRASARRASSWRRRASPMPSTTRSASA